MGYNRSAMGGMAVGDPFIGGLIKDVGGFIGGVAKTALNIGGAVIPGPVGAVMKMGSAVMGGSRTKQMVASAPVMPGGGMTSIRGVPIGPQIINGQQPRVTKSGMVTTRKRPRMDPNNTRALRRAIRRVEAHVRQEQRLKKTMGKVASHYRPRRGSRRDLPRGHVHVR